MVKSSSSKVLHTPNSSIPLPGTITTTTTTTTTTTKLQPKAESTRKTQYKGVRMRKWGSWVSEIRAPHQKTRIWLGSYSTPEAAARAYDAALLCLKGSSAGLNFPTSLANHPSDPIMSPKSIQRVAAAAAANTATPTTTSTLTVEISTPSPSPPPPSSPSLPSDTTGDSPSTTTSSTSCMVDTVEEESWIDLGTLQSPKFVDQMIDPLISPWEELDEEVDFKLWSFC